MKTFASLLANPGADFPATVQQNAERRFGQQISQSRLHRRELSEPPGVNQYVVIGIATYSPLELALLDEINSQSRLWSDRWRIDVFSILGCKSLDDFQKYMPGVKQEIHQTPVVAVWDQGKLVTCTTGLKASRDLLQHIAILCPYRSDSSR